jgi:GT2 family glycosyltransferase
LEDGSDQKYFPPDADLVNSDNTDEQKTDTAPVEASVIVINYNGLEHLSVCLGSLSTQTHRSYEIILVDNGSTDGSEAYVRSAFPAVRVVRLDRNVGFCGGNNVGFLVARGSFVALLNNDTEVEPQWLEALCMAMNSDPMVGLCASRMIRFSDRGVIDNAGDLLTPAGCAVERGRGQANGPRFSETCEVFGACAGAALYRRSMLDDIGLLDEHLFLTYEDLDLSFRARLAGYRCLYVGSATMYHKVRGTMNSFPAQQVFQSQRNIEWVWMKNMPGWLMFKYFHHRVFYWFGSAAFFIRQGHGLTFAKAKVAALAGCVPILRQRRRIQKSRRVSISALEELLFHDWITVKARKFVASR